MVEIFTHTLPLEYSLRCAGSDTPKFEAASVSDL